MRVLVIAALSLLAAPAGAQPATGDRTPIHPGAQPVPPVHASEPVLNQDLEGRHAVRGCSPDEKCAKPSDLLKEFEVEAFPRPGKDPWLDERAAPPSRLEASKPRLVKKPSELRPDAPWLDGLDLPDLPIKWSQKLVDYLVFYKDATRGRAIMQSWLVAQGRYRDMILGYLRKAKLPEDLLYVAMIESGYEPEDTSSAGALGLWQFMPEGGKIYGLREDHWVDERRDPYRSTIAQMDYFADLYQRFSDWHIALAAFNMGYGAMLRSITRYNTNDFYQLCEYENGIPWETCLYTPKILAAAIVGHNRSFFGYDKLKEVAPEKWDDVAVPVSMSLGIIARAAGATEAEIKRLNPQLRHGRTPPSESGYVVRVPAGAKGDFGKRLVELESEWSNYDSYVVAHGERFEDIATTFGISLWQLKKLNDVTREAELDGGTVLVVPRVSEEQRAKNKAKAKAKLLGSGVDQRDGEPLIVPVPNKDTRIANRLRVFYRVVAGDSLRSVAKAFGLAKDKLIEWNDLDGDGNLHPKMVLQLFVPADFHAEAKKVELLDEGQLIVVTRGSPEHLDLAEQRTGRVRTEYVAQGKEKLSEIAAKFGMGSHDLARINRISFDTVLAKGDTVIVYQVKDPSRSKRADEQWRKTPRSHRGRVTGTPAERTASKLAPDDGKPDDKPANDKPANDKPANDKPANDKPANDKPAVPPAEGPITSPEP